MQSGCACLKRANCRMAGVAKCGFRAGSAQEISRALCGAVSCAAVGCSTAVGCVVTDGEGTGFRMKTGNSIWDRFSLSAVRLQKADALLYFRPSRGVVAQLGERLGRIEEVVSSILIHSTRVSKPAHDGGFVCCRGVPACPPRGCCASCTSSWKSSRKSSRKSRANSEGKHDATSLFFEAL